MTGKGILSVKLRSSYLSSSDEILDINVNGYTFSVNKNDPDLKQLIRVSKGLAVDVTFDKFCIMTKINDIDNFIIMSISGAYTNIVIPKTTAIDLVNMMVEMIVSK